MVNNAAAGQLNQRNAAAENNSCCRNVLLHVELGGSERHMHTVTAQPDNNAVFGHFRIFKKCGGNIGYCAYRDYIQRFLR